MAYQMLETPQTITVYNYLSDTGEFIGGGEAYVAPHTGLPAYCTDIIPQNDKQGYVQIFDTTAQKWIYQEDHRGVTVYDTRTRQAFTMDKLGGLPEGTTLIIPGEFNCWDGQIWVKDDKLEKAHFVAEAEEEKKRLLEKTSVQLDTINDAVELGIATTEEKNALVAWKTYRVYLSRIDTSVAPDITWPDIPKE